MRKALLVLSVLLFGIVTFGWITGCQKKEVAKPVVTSTPAVTISAPAVVVPEKPAVTAPALPTTINADLENKTITVK